MASTGVQTPSTENNSSAASRMRARLRWASARWGRTLEKSYSSPISKTGFDKSLLHRSGSSSPPPRSSAMPVHSAPLRRITPKIVRTFMRPANLERFRSRPSAKFDLGRRHDRDCGLERHGAPKRIGCRPDSTFGLGLAPVPVGAEPMIPVRWATSRSTIGAIPAVTWVLGRSTRSRSRAPRPKRSRCSAQCRQGHGISSPAGRDRSGFRRSRRSSSRPGGGASRAPAWRGRCGSSAATGPRQAPRRS